MRQISRRRISTHAPRTGSDYSGEIACIDLYISTHAPRTGSDKALGLEDGGEQGISTHAPRTGSDGECTETQMDSTISTHAPRTGSDQESIIIRRESVISTHAPRTGSDFGDEATAKAAQAFQPTLPARGATLRSEKEQEDTTVFQPTLPARGATRAERFEIKADAISTHAPRTGSDRRFGAVLVSATDFNPRSPHGERRFLSVASCTTGAFQPTLPARGAT